MGKICYRFFGGLLRTQTRWLNRMAAKGYRLVHTGKLRYEFAPCQPDEFVYCVEYVGGMAGQNAEEYKGFLEEMGYRVFFKNINLNYSVGKVYYRPWAEKGGRIGTNATTLNKELFIVEKRKDGNPFQLHSTYADQVKYLKSLRNPWLCMLALFLLFWFWKGGMLFAVFTLLFLVPAALYEMEILRLSRDAKAKEW